MPIERTASTTKGIRVEIPTALGHLSYPLQTLLKLFELSTLRVNPDSILAQSLAELESLAGERDPYSIYAWVLERLLETNVTISRKAQTSISRIDAAIKCPAHLRQPHFLGLGEVTENSPMPQYAETARQARAVAQSLTELVGYLRPKAELIPDRLPVDFKDFPHEGYAKYIREMVTLICPPELLKVVRYSKKNTKLRLGGVGIPLVSAYDSGVKELIIYPDFFMATVDEQKGTLVHELIGHSAEVNPKEPKLYRKDLEYMAKQLISITALWSPYRTPATENVRAYKKIKCRSKKAKTEKASLVWSEQFADIMELLYALPKSLDRLFNDKRVRLGFTAYAAEILKVPVAELMERFEQLKALQLEEPEPIFPRPRQGSRKEKVTPDRVLTTVSEVVHDAATRQQADRAAGEIIVSLPAVIEEPEIVEVGRRVVYENFAEKPKLLTTVRTLMSELKPNTNAIRLVHSIVYDAKQAVMKVGNEQVKVVAAFDSGRKAMIVYDEFFKMSHEVQLNCCVHEIFGHGTEFLFPTTYIPEGDPHTELKARILELKDQWSPYQRPIESWVRRYTTQTTYFSDGTKFEEKDVWNEQWAFAIAKMCRDPQVIIDMFGNAVYQAFLAYIAARQGLSQAEFIERIRPTFAIVSKQYEHRTSSRFDPRTLVDL